MKFTDEDIAFMDSLNNTGVIESNIYFTAKHSQYMRNLDRNLLVNLEAIFKRVFNQPKFSLCYHCSKDVMSLVLKLYGELDKEKVMRESIAGMVEETVSDNVKKKIKK